MQIENNIPAYPKPCCETCGGQSGLTALDHFAGLAMQGFISSDTRDVHIEFADAKYISEHAYKMADAMLEARKSYIN